MEAVAVGTSYCLLSDSDLIELLRTDGDALPREAVDEFVARGVRLVGPLTEIARDDEAWLRGGTAAWAPIHAAFILGAIGLEEALDGLLAVLRWSARREVGKLEDAVPNMIGAVGRPAIPRLRELLEEGTEREQVQAVYSLAAVAARHPVEQGGILDFLRVVTRGESPEEVRLAAAHVLLQFARPVDRKLVQHWAGRQACPLFDLGDVEAAYRRGAPEVEEYLRDWLVSYDAAAIEDARWAKGAKSCEPWVDRACASILEMYGEERVAASMMRHLIEDRRCAPWRWDRSAVASYFDYFVRKVAIDDPAGVADRVMSFVGFWASEGRVTQAAFEEVKAYVAADRGRFEREARDSARWSVGKAWLLDLPSRLASRPDDGALSARVARSSFR